MAADDLVMNDAKASAAIVVTQFAQNDLCLIHVHTQCLILLMFNS